MTGITRVNTVLDVHDKSTQKPSITVYFALKWKKGIQVCCGYPLFEEKKKFKGEISPVSGCPMFSFW